MREPRMSYRPRPPDVGKPLISASALREATCLRRYGLHKIDGAEFSRDGKPWLARGERQHQHLERWRHEGAARAIDLTDPEQVIASAAIPHWDAGPWEPEVEILIDRGPFAYWGFADQLGASYVGDYKFTGSRDNLPGRAKGVEQTHAELMLATAAILLRDEQWILYANACTDLRKGALIRGQWTYVIPPARDREGNLRGEPIVYPVALSADRQTLERQLGKLDERADAMISTRRIYAIPPSQVVPAHLLNRRTATANAIPHSADTACQGVGIRCDFSIWCRLTDPGEIKHG